MGRGKSEGLAPRKSREMANKQIKFIYFIKKVKHGSFLAATAVRVFILTISSGNLIDG